MRSGGSWRSAVVRRLGWQIAVAGAFALLAVRTLDTRQLVDVLREVQVLWLPPALLLFTTAKFIDAWRWRFLLREVIRR